MLAPLAGGWLAAARLPIAEALAWVEDHLSKQAWDAHGRSLQIWASTLPAYVNGGTIPDPPEPPED